MDTLFVIITTAVIACLVRDYWENILPRIVLRHVVIKIKASLPADASKEVLFAFVTDYRNEESRILKLKMAYQMYFAFEDIDFPDCE